MRTFKPVTGFTPTASLKKYVFRGEVALSKITCWARAYGEKTGIATMKMSQSSLLTLSPIQTVYA